MWRLQKLPTEQGLQLLHKIIDGTCGRTYPLYQDYHRIWDSAEWMHVLEDITTFFRAVVGKNLSDEEISQQLNQLNSSHQEAIMKCLKSRKDEIKKTLLEEIVDISSARLQDFDWQIKVRIYLFVSIYIFYLEKEMATQSSILAGESHEQRSLVGYRPWSRKESDRSVFRRRILSVSLFEYVIFL